MEQPTPAFGKLIARDRNILYALLLTFMPGFVFIYSMIFSGEMFQLRWDARTVFLSGTSILGVIYFIYQYTVVMTTFRDGITVKGNIIRTERKTSRRKRGGRTSTYYAIVSYSLNNEPIERSFKLPGKPEKYGLAEGVSVDLILREEKPNTVFIKQIYLD